MTIKQQGGVFGRNPSFNDVEMNDLDANIGLFNRLGVNVTGTTARPVEFNATVRIADGAVIEWGGTTANIAGSSSSNTLFFRTNGEAGRFDSSKNLDLTYGGGNIKMANGKGIDFSATSGTGTSELFDDYEEGRFDTVLTDTGAASTITLTRARCDYVKVGRLVHVTGEVTIDTITGTPTGDIQMTLPFVGATSNQRSARSRRFISITSLAGSPTGHGEGFIEGNGATVMTLQKADDFIITNLASNIQSGTNFQFDFTYQSAS